MIDNLLYCPLDLPKIPSEITLDNFELFDTILAPVYDSQNVKHSWRMLVLTQVVDNPQQIISSDHRNDSLMLLDNQLNFNLKWSWKPGILQYAPKLVKWIEENLPLEKKTLVAILCSQKAITEHSDVRPHRQHDPINDVYRAWDPSMFRFLLDGELIKDSFFVIQNGKKVYTELPDQSPGWAMSLDCIHGNDDPTPDKKILLYVMGKINPLKHRELLERSINKYKNNAIFK